MQAASQLYANPGAFVSQSASVWNTAMGCCITLRFLLSVSELQEEGMNAINLPLSPIPFELDPEDTMLGNGVSCSLWVSLMPSEPSPR